MGRFKLALASLNCDGGRGVALLALCVLFLSLVALGLPAALALQYDRTAIAGGEWWRLITAHMVHLGWEHAGLNVAGLVLMWALFAREYSPLRWGAIILGSVLAIDAGLWFRDPQVEWYVGASGVLHGAMAAGAVARIRRGDRDGWLLALFLLAKISYEQHAGVMPFSAGVGPVIVNAHLYGAAGALLVSLLQRRRRSL